MTDLVESGEWEDGIYQLEESDPVKGGPDGIDNLQAKQLGNRTSFLRLKADGTLRMLMRHIMELDVHPQYAPVLSPALLGSPTAPTPPLGDDSDRMATTAFVKAAIGAAVLSNAVGQIVFEARTTARAGYLKLNGASLHRDDYPALWAYAQTSGALVTDDDWSKNNWGCFSSGDGATTFRIPELRGEMLRCWDDGRGVDGSRGIGTWQDSQNRSHAHGASAAAVGDHVHSAWTDAQGWHAHHGNTHGSGNHQHVSPYGESGVAPWGTHAVRQVGSHGGVDGDNPWAFTSVAGMHDHSFYTEGAGDHDHNVGIGGAGAHSHPITVNPHGGNETRVRNLAMTAMIRAY